MERALPDAWIQTYTGRAFWPLEPNPVDVDIRDIAHALSLLCRFGGHSRRFYSVAEHSLLVASQTGLHGLLHDAAEAYAVDLPRPIKLGLPSYSVIEERVLRAIYQRFGFPWPTPGQQALVKVADDRVLATERLVLHYPEPRAWGLTAEPYEGMDIRCLDQAVAASMTPHPGRAALELAWATMPPDLDHVGRVSRAHAAYQQAMGKRWTAQDERHAASDRCLCGELMGHLEGAGRAPMVAVEPTSPPAIEVAGASLSVRFSRFDLAAYEVFLRCKALPESEVVYDWQSDVYIVTAPARFAGMLGAQATATAQERLPLAPHLFDYQRWIVERALTSKRLACWCDTGLGKTIIFLEWARQVMHFTGGRVLIFTPLQVISQVIEEASRFYGDALPIERIESRAALAEWCKRPGLGLGITNHHKLVDGTLPELRYLAGVVLDEASILRAGGGKIKWAMIHSCKGIEYKLSCTATPAPNEVMEYASQASWLEKLRDGGDILWTYFHKTKAGDWEVKPYARPAFYRFMASWSVYLRDPARFGFNDILAALPAPDIREYKVQLTDPQRELAMAFRTVGGKGMFDDRMGVQERSRLSQLAKGFLYDNSGSIRRAARIASNKPGFVADLVRQDMGEGRQVLVWSVFDEEGAILQEQLPDLGVAVLNGSMSETARLETLERFARGDVRVLISKAALVGYGMNFQFCRSMVFSGFDDSFERMYQAIRRCYRFGQTETVRVHVPYVPELEGMIFNNVRAKEVAFLRDVTLQEVEYRGALESHEN